MGKQTTLTYTAAKLKAESYCAYQERSQQEVRDKLYAWGLHSTEVENILVDLIQENYINEERFALAYAGGKHRIKKWGKLKIQQGLKLKGVSNPLIKIALDAIDMDEYFANLEEVLKKKAATVKHEDAFKRKNALVNYAIGRGYETSLIIEILNNNEL
jgi:regulatory protein